MLWIKELEMVESVDELRSSSSTRGISMPNFEVLDARPGNVFANPGHSPRIQNVHISGPLHFKVFRD